MPSRGVAGGLGGAGGMVTEKMMSPAVPCGVGGATSSVPVIGGCSDAATG